MMRNIILTSFVWSMLLIGSLIVMNDYTKKSLGWEKKTIEVILVDGTSKTIHTKVPKNGRFQMLDNGLLTYILPIRGDQQTVCVCKFQIGVKSFKLIK